MRRMRNQVLLPMNLEIKITENDPVRKLVEICEELDYSKLYAQYLRTWRKYNPETLFMLLVCGYMNRLYSSREIEKACRTDIRFMWILQDEPVPDHSTIARFQEGRLLPVIEDLFYQLIVKLMTLGEVSLKFQQQREESLRNIQSEEGILLRMNRSIQVEGTFGVWKQDYRFRRFAMRGKQGAETQLFLLAFAYTIQKLCNRMESGRFGQALFEKQIA